MTCPACQGKFRLKYKYRVQGKRYGRVPGVVRVYVCGACHTTVRYLEVSETFLLDWARQWEARRQDWIRETASLREKVNWLLMPATQADDKLKAIRQELIRLIEQTF